MKNEPEIQVTGITLNGIGKKFRDQWIFRSVSFEIKPGERIAITGYNGSGKSTLLQLIAGYITQSEGSVSWHSTQGAIPVESWHRHISLAAPYMDLIEDFTLEENVNFFSRHKKLQEGITTEMLMQKARLSDSGNKLVRNFSSGMRQRLKLALAFLADTQVLLLDEPLSNLDTEGYEWYRELTGTVNEKRIVLLCSNQVREETFFCNRTINMESFK